MQAEIFAALMGCCTLTAGIASDRQIPTVDLQDFKGQYDLVGGCLLSITQRGHRLVMQLGNQPEADLVAIGSGTFVTRSGNVRLEFVRYPNGNVPAVRMFDTSTRSNSIHTADASADKPNTCARL
jgi:hypothetical protein